MMLVPDLTVMVHVDRPCCICGENIVHEGYLRNVDNGDIEPGGRDTCDDCADELATIHRPTHSQGKPGPLIISRDVAWAIKKADAFLEEAGIQAQKIYSEDPEVNSLARWFLAGMSWDTLQRMADERDELSHAIAQLRDRYFNYGEGYDDWMDEMMGSPLSVLEAIRDLLDRENDLLKEAIALIWSEWHGTKPLSAGNTWIDKALETLGKSRDDLKNVLVEATHIQAQRVLKQMQEEANDG